MVDRNLVMLQKCIHQSTPSSSAGSNCSRTLIKWSHHLEMQILSFLHLQQPQLQPFRLGNVQILHYKLFVICLDQEPNAYSILSRIFLFHRNSSCSWGRMINLLLHIGRVSIQATKQLLDSIDESLFLQIRVKRGWPCIKKILNSSRQESNYNSIVIVFLISFYYSCSSPNEMGKWLSKIGEWFEGTDLMCNANRQWTTTLLLHSNNFKLDSHSAKYSSSLIAMATCDMMNDSVRHFNFAFLMNYGTKGPQHS